MRIVEDGIDFRGFDLLQGEELKFAVLAAQAGDTEARRQIVESYLPFVARMVREFRVPSSRFNDALQEGVLGLIQAIGTYDPESSSLMHWSRFYVRNAIRFYLKRDRAIRPPTLAFNRGRAYEAAFIARMPVWARCAAIDPIEAIDGKVQDGRRTRSLSEIVPSNEPGPPEIVDGRLQGERLRDAFRFLPERDQQILFRRAEGATMVELADELGVTKQFVAKLKSQAMRKLRSHFGCEDVEMTLGEFVQEYDARRRQSDSKRRSRFREKLHRANRER